MIIYFAIYPRIVLSVVIITFSLNRTQYLKMTIDSVVKLTSDEEVMEIEAKKAFHLTSGDRQAKFDADLSVCPVRAKNRHTDDTEAEVM